MSPAHPSRRHAARCSLASRRRRGIVFVGTLLSFALVALGFPAGAGDWPQILGPARDGVAANEPELTPWKGDVLRQLWRFDVGEGFAGPAVVGDRLVVFHRLRNEEVVQALDTSDGKSLWRASYPTSYRDDFGFNAGPRAVPTIAGGRVLTHGAEGVVTAFDLASGRQLWQRHLGRELDVPKGFFGVASSPVVEGDLVLVQAGGGEGESVLALDAATGVTRWSAADDEASYSSPVVVDLAGQRGALFFTREGLVVLDPKKGAVQMRFPWKTRIRSSVNAAVPLFLDGKVFLSASYGAGAVLLDVTAGQPRVLWSGDDSLTNHYATAVHHQGMLYGFHGRQESRPALRCIELATGKVRWSQESYGAGSLLRVADRLLVLREDGHLELVQASSDAYVRLARAKILDTETRALPALADGRLYARDERRLVAVALR